MRDGAHVVGVGRTRHAHRHLKSALFYLVRMQRLDISLLQLLSNIKKGNHLPDRLLALLFCTQEGGTC